MQERYLVKSSKLPKLSKKNSGYRYILMVIDVFSKYGWAVPLKTKTGKEVAAALQLIFEDNKPKKLWVDKGKEFYNKNVAELLKESNVHIYSTNNDENMHDYLTSKKYNSNNIELNPFQVIWLGFLNDD